MYIQLDSKSEVERAKRELEVAQNRLDMAETPEMIDAACLELTAAELKFRAALLRARNNTGE